ncbi:RNA polymerase sigma-70 factor (ECF subfamily) [Leeuwenhoekiella aestuarii]|uniref:RNA polymerase sigma-70 factor (ECF subfamily) n=1 Tax=Leeuwenhoekiella aestuarii TaxID=2249426 RepID=A0A4Q0NZI3_9FLAO|nr:RNA polymerase sigma-70 factor [Leeuwenhoekiella aestuarii]RXG18374.1 RNA polymerase sigma-70 factor (ECF subfamily) [Leeuwenhoekiella aestuarii]RXG19679.1 RNA polymerase sigma-70 factor (ECF subfamily) [Leeuwenhoekiella aestuarii]
MQEQIVLQRIIHGDEEAFRFFFKTNYASLFSYIISLTFDKDEAEDLTQQAFIKLWTNRAKIDISKSTKSYLFTIGYNLFLDSQKKLKNQRNYIQELQHNAIIDEINNEEILHDKILELRKAIDLLPEKCKTILLLNKVDGLKYQEIAEKLDISVKTVESQMRIAFQKIRETFKNDKIILWLLFNSNLFKQVT